MDSSSIIVRVVAGVLALVVLGIIIYRRKQKAKKKLRTGGAVRFQCSE